MRKRLIWSLVLGPVLLVGAHAGVDGDGVKSDKGAPLAQEFEFNTSYVGGADMKQGNAKIGSVDESSVLANYVLSPEIKEGLLLRVGVEWERYSFGLPSAVSLPNTLEAASAIVGFDIQVSDSLLLRVEAQPGVYGNLSKVDSDSMNAPIIAGGSYLVNKDLQWFFGVGINVHRQYPILPGAGVRWKFSDNWTLNFLLPRPRLEYDVNKTLKLYAGADLRGNSFRMTDDFGNFHGKGHQNLNGTWVDYTEARVGAGVSWKVFPSVTLEAETGAMVVRDYDFYRAHTDFHNNEAAPYGQIAIKGNF